MVEINEVLQMFPTADDIANALLTAQEQTVKQLTGNIYKDNLRHRTMSISFDSKFRGALGEQLMLRLFYNNGVNVQTFGCVHDDNGDIDMNAMGSIQNYSVEVKTSLLAGHTQTLESQMNNFSLIVQRKHDFIEDDVTRDLHVQILYAMPRADRDELVNRNEPYFSRDVFNFSIGDLYNMFAAQQLADNMYIAAWTTRDEIINYVNSLPSDARTWSYFYQNPAANGQSEQAMREYWNYPLRIAYPPETLCRYIKETQWDRQRRHEREQKAAHIRSRQGNSL